MALDYISALVDAHWSPWEASADFNAAVRVGNRKKLDASVLARDVIRRSPAEFPSVKVEPINGNLGNGAPRTFGGNVVGATSAQLGNPVIPGSHSLKITIVYDKPALSDETPLEAIMKGLLLATWPNLGLSWVSGFTFNETRRVAADAPVKGVIRTTVELTNIIAIRPRLAQLTG